MKLILATSNQGKIKEIQEICHGLEVVAYSDLVEPFEIEENGHTFQENALIKARAVYRSLNDKDAVVLADDSGISIDALDAQPGIYSARYAGIGATDRENLDKVVSMLQQKGLQSSKAHYTAAIALIIGGMEYTTHGWMYGDVITTPRGEHGFGYDPIFIPKGYEKTLGELDGETKRSLSHRSKALELAKILLFHNKK
jgi:XTP/dITP diphosphohydrolase